jgi:hypothetical protein
MLYCIGTTANYEPCGLLMEAWRQSFIDEWLASRSSRFTPDEIDSSTHCLMGSF